MHAKRARAHAVSSARGGRRHRRREIMLLCCRCRPHHDGQAGPKKRGSADSTAARKRFRRRRRHTTVRRSAAVGFASFVLPVRRRRVFRFIYFYFRNYCFPHNTRSRPKSRRSFVQYGPCENPTATVMYSARNRNAMITGVYGICLIFEKNCFFSSFCPKLVIIMPRHIDFQCRPRFDRHLPFGIY